MPLQKDAMMTGPDLLQALTPLVGVAGRERLRTLRTGESVTLRYDHIKDWDALGAIMMRHEDELKLFDGQEWFTLVVVGGLIP